jgi:transposase
MTSTSSTMSPVVRVAIDIAKLTHQVLLELPNGKRRGMRVTNTKTEIDRFVAVLRALEHPCEVAFEPTGDYHRPLAYILGQAGCHLRLVSSIAVARTREALYNSWDKNDPKDAQVILHLLKNGTTQRYLDPFVTGHQDLQEMANTYQQVSLRKVRLQHSLVTHHLPLYFPEAERYLHSSRAEWFTELLLSRHALLPYGVTPRRRLSPLPASRSAGGRSTRRAGSPTSMRPRAAVRGCP